MKERSINSVSIKRPDKSALIAAAQAGDRAAMDELVRLDFGLIYACIKRRVPAGDWDEYLGIGAEAYMRAVKNFDPGRGFQLSTLVTAYIDRQLLDEVRTAGIIRLPRKGTTASAEKLQPQRDAARRVTFAGVYLRSDWAAGKDSGPSAGMEAAETRLVIQNAMERLDERDRQIILARVNGRCLADIGREVGLCKERVRQIELEAMGTLREAVAA